MRISRILARLRAAVPVVLVPLFLLAACGGRSVAPRLANPIFTVTPDDALIDTNCVGCNASAGRSGAALQFRAPLRQGAPADVLWSLSGGDPGSGPGSISAAGLYVPPAFLTEDRVEVFVTAALRSDPSIRASARVQLLPGFQQPLAPANAAVPAGGSVGFVATLAEAGGGAVARFRLAATPSGSGAGLGSLGPVRCQRNARSFTACTVDYTAPQRPPAGAVVYLIAEAAQPLARMEAAILLDAGGVASAPTAHQALLSSPVALGSSGGNAGDYDTRADAVVDCCSGTLGALVQDGSGHRFVLGNNHVLARSDHAHPGDRIVQPGLIDSACTPGAGTPIATLKSWLPLSATTTNADAALAEPLPNAVSLNGSILELGARQPDGTLAAAPPGISSTGGNGESPRLDLRVAKSGRTTGLTCGAVTAIDLDVSVDYFRDCAETEPYLTRLFTHQLGLSGNRFSDSGDSGALVVDAANAEPVGLYFAGGRDQMGVAEGIATPAPEVLAALSAQAGSAFSFVGGADHPVQCLSFGDATVAEAQALPLSRQQIARVRRGLAAARLLVHPASGVLGVALGKSSDHPGEAAVIVYIAAGSSPQVPASFAGVRTMVVVTSAQTLASGSAPLANAVPFAAPLPPALLERALAVKRESVREWLHGGTAIFGMGVGRSLDDPREAAIVLYVDRRRAAADLPQSIGGVRTRIILMDRLHVTRSYGRSAPAPASCRPGVEQSSSVRTFVSVPLP